MMLDFIWGIILSLQIARLQLAQQELQDRRYDEAENERIRQEVNRMRKELASIQEKINENMEAVCYELADMM